MARTIDPKKGQEFLEKIYNYGLIGIGFREVKRLTGFANDTLVTWLNHFRSRNLTYKDLGDKIHLNEDIRSKLEKGDLLIQSIIPQQSKSSKRRSPPSKRSTGKRIQKHISKERSNYAYCLITTIAAIGNSFWYRTTDHGYGIVSMTDMTTGNDVNFISKPLMGIGFSDFMKKEKEGIQSMLDTRTFVNYAERFSYLNLSDQEAQFYINQLCGHDPPILKEIRVFDYKFLCFVDDSDQPDSIRLEQESPYTYAQNTVRLTLNTDYDNDDKLSPIHEINYDTYHDKITSRILIDVNSEKAKESLGIDTLYNESNNFSISIWGEKRYIIADPVLRGFIEICNFMFEVVYRKMEILYSRSLLSKDVRREYLRWYGNVYGCYRRGAEILRLDRIAVNRIKQNIKKIRRFEKQDKIEERKKIMEELDYICRHRIWGPYERTGIHLNNRDFTPQDFKNIEKSLKPIDENLRDMIHQLDISIERYHSQLISQKYEDTRQTYSFVTEPLLNMSYPAFLRSLIK